MTKQLQIDFDTLRKGAEAEGRKPRFHGNGFVQLYLGERHRLHVFHPDLGAVRTGNSCIHDHRWDMFSTVLLGAVGHTAYNITMHPTGLCAINVAPNASDKTSPIEKMPNSRCVVIVKGEYRLAAGSTYFFPKRQFHQSDADQLTMTLIEKGPDDDAPARIISPYGETPIHAFEQQPAQERLWSAIEDALITWRKERDA